MTIPNAPTTPKTGIEWTKPEGLGIQWFPEQRMPEPCVELTMAEFMLKFHTNDYGLQGHMYDQLILDWGQGPLVKKPKRWWSAMSECHSSWKVEGTLVRYKGTTDPIGKLVKSDTVTALIEFPQMPDYAPRFINQTELEIERLDTGYGGWDSFANLWGVTFYWFTDYGLALAKTYIREADLGIKSHVFGKGTFIPTGDPSMYNEVYGYAMRFFRIGCMHTRLEHKTYRMFDHEDICLDCGWRHRYDSSG